MLIALLALLGCSTAGIWVAPEPSTERMLVQARVDPYEDPRLPPEGAVPAASALALAPAPVDRELLLRGRDRFEIFCAPCHGLDGAALTPVARAMPLPPRDLRAPEIGPERVTAAIREGYGLMPAYADRVAGLDEQAVVAWVGVLQRVEVQIGQLPPDVRERVLREAR